MSKVLIWDDGISFENNDILVFLDQDYYDLYTEEEYTEVASFHYILSPNYSESILQVLIYYIYLKHADICLKDEFLDSNIQFKIWEDIIIALNTFNVDLFIKNYELIKRYSLYNKYHNIFQKLHKYFLLVIKPFTQSLYFNTNSADKSKQWFNNEVSTLTHFTKYDNEDSTTLFSKQSDALVKTKIKALRKLNSNTDKLFYMSCYCYQLAIYNLELHQYQISFILLQRTLDFYFQSRALENSLIVPTRRGMEFDYTEEFNGQPVGLYFLQKCLQDSGNLQANRDRSQFLTWLNDTRNTSILTHGVFNVDKINVEDAIKKIVHTIEIIEGTKRWEIMSKSFSLTSNYDFNIIFDLEPSIELYFSVP